jgi:hypothetical protein
VGGAGQRMLGLVDELGKKLQNARRPRAFTAWACIGCSFGLGISSTADREPDY